MFVKVLEAFFTFVIVGSDKIKPIKEKRRI